MPSGGLPILSQRVLGLIPARGGSKGIPGKNIRSLAGKPLLAYTVDSAQASGMVDRLVLTTDSEKIAELGRTLGVEVPFIRPVELAQDDTPMLPVVEHAVAELEKSGWEPTIILLLQPDVPLRKPEHLRKAVSMLMETDCDSVVSVVPFPKHFSPHYAMRIDERGVLTHVLPEGRLITRRQDVPTVFLRDGAVYAMWRRVLMGEHSLYGSDCRPMILQSGESFSLNSLEDWAEAERRLADHAGAARRTVLGD